jgi:FkbM family methyltransferase
VVAFEPEEFAFMKLERFVLANRLSQVTCKRVALSDGPPMLRIFVPPKSYGNHNPSTSAYCDDMTAQEIPATTLDRCFAMLGVNSVDLLKIDVEGHEFEVLRGGLRSIRAGCIKTILCELNNKMLGIKGSSARALYEWLLGVGFRDLDGIPDFRITSQNRRFVFATLSESQLHI